MGAKIDIFLILSACGMQHVCELSEKEGGREMKFDLNRDVYGYT